MNTEARSKRKEKIGVVISNKMDKTVTIRVTKKMRHPKYGKVVELNTKLYAHDESDAVELGQTVRVMETRPLSKLKRWRVVEVIQ